MPTHSDVIISTPEEVYATGPEFARSDAPNWLYNLRLLWADRRLMLRAAAVSLAASLTISLLIPNTYVSQARIMPPEHSGSEAALLGALAGRSLEGELLGGLAASLMQGRSSGALFVDLLRSGSVTSPLIDRFKLQDVYGKRYRVDAAKVLARRTDITQDKKSGIITVSVKDHDPRRARDMAQAYLDELNLLVNRTNTSSAHQERVFIEKRLASVKSDLERAQEAMSEFSSTHSTIDLKEQAKATVESQAKLEGEMVVAQAELQSLEQVYGNENVRVRAAEARVGSLRREMDKMGGSAAPLPETTTQGASSNTSTGAVDNGSYLPLRQVPRLAVPYANLYRELHVQETVYGMLTQQYEVARIQEAKDVPAVNVIDAPGIPEKKSFPPRTVMTLGLAAAMLLLFSAWRITRHYWLALDRDDPRRLFADEVSQAAARTIKRATGFARRSS